MPTEISHTPSLQPEVSSSLPLRILNKGPSYLRRQMEGDNRGRLSAVARLAADKAKYVKSQRVMASKQEPVGLGSSASEGGTSTNSSASTSTESDLGTSAKQPGHRGKPSRQDLQGLSTSNTTTTTTSSNATSTSGDLFQTPFQQASAIARRSSSKRQMRPDSLVIYRQKCEFVKGASGESPRGHQSLVRRLFQGAGRDKQVASPEVPKVIIKEDSRSGSRASSPAGSEPEGTGPVTPPPPPTPGPRGKLAAPGRLQELQGRGLHRSQSDISSRYSKAFSEFDSFFRYCGLEPEVVEDLGREKFSSSAASDSLARKVRSASVPGSESEFSRHSGDNERLLEGELSEQNPSSLSVIERNARVIKWLYGCKRAKESKAAVLV